MKLGEIIQESPRAAACADCERRRAEMLAAGKADIAAQLARTKGDHPVSVKSQISNPSSPIANPGGFRVLNAKLAPSVPTIPTAAPDVWFMDVHGEKVIFDSNSLCAVHVDQSTFDHLKELGTAKDAKTAKDGQNEKSVLGDLGDLAVKSVHGLRGLLWSRDKPQFRLAAQTPIRKVVLNVTHNCNLACAYCFVSNHEGTKTTKNGNTGNQVEASEDCRESDDAVLRDLSAFVVEMPFDVAMSGVALIEPGQPLDIAFFGGEPLLAWNLIRQVMLATKELAARRKVPCKFHITTNATLLTRDKLEFLKTVPCSLLISLDGPQEIHDAARPFRNRQDAEDARQNTSVLGALGDLAVESSSFSAVMRALELAADLGLSKRIMARATFLEGEARLAERLEFFAALQDAGLIAGFSIEPAILSEGCGRRDPNLPVSQSPNLQAEYHSAAEWFLSRLRAGKSVGFFHYRKLLERILYTRHAASECGAGRGYITIAPDGTIHACHREGTKIGSLDSLDSPGSVASAPALKCAEGSTSGFDEQLRAPWQENRLYARPDCTVCWARYLCGGGCRQARLELGGNLRADTPALCALKQTMIRECLWILTQADPAAIRAAVPDGHRPSSMIHHPSSRGVPNDRT